MKSGKAVLDVRYCQAVIDAAHNGILAINRRGEIIIFNTMASKILNIDKEEVLAHPTSAYVARCMAYILSVKNA